MSYLVNLTLTGRRAVVVGGGPVLASKIADLCSAGAAVTVVAPAVCDEIRSLAGAGRIILHERDYHPEDLQGAFLVVAFTESEDLNAQVFKDADGRGILVNVVDRPPLCSFTLPAVVRRDDLTLAIATDGRCPAFSSALRLDLESRFGAEYGEALGLFAELRKEMMARGWGSARIKQTILDIYQAGLVALIQSRRIADIEQLLRCHLGEDFPLPGARCKGWQWEM